MVMQVEKMQAHSPTEKATATEKKEERLAQAEVNKLKAIKHNAEARFSPKDGSSNPGFTPGANISPTGTASYSTTGVQGQATGGHQMSAIPGHGTGQPTDGYVVDGVVESHPIEVHSAPASTMAHNTEAGGNPVVARIVK